MSHIQHPVIAVIGGGAAGFFAAISCKTHHPDAEVTLYEKSAQLLAKVKISGGGRCNVTHACFSNSQLVKFYPRGEKQLKKAFAHFSTIDTIKWFESRGVKLKTEEDGRMFPVTDNSQTVINCLLKETEKLGIHIKIHQPVLGIERVENPNESGSNGFNLTFRVPPNPQMGAKGVYCDKVIVASGGSPKAEGFDWLKKLGHTIEPPVPSLFTFNMPDQKLMANGHQLTALMGVSVDDVTVRIMGTKLRSEGPLLITHWGMSGPAILKLSAFGARILNELNYTFTIQVNWIRKFNEDEAREILVGEIKRHPKRLVRTSNPLITYPQVSRQVQIPDRLNLFFLSKLDINPETPLESLGKKNQNRLLNAILNDEYKVQGKTTFKEEFVTCGGISLNDVSMDTMESNVCPGMYFAGEVLDIDGVTGGFNFQAAWTTGFIAGKLA